MSGNTSITSAFKLNNTLQFIESFSEAANNMYFMFAGRHLPFDNDSNPPAASDSVKGTVIDVFDNMLYGKNISPSDVQAVTRKIIWSSGTVYDRYTDDVTNLYATNFYVAYKDGTSYKVFKCLDNNGGTPSTVPPVSTIASDFDYTTSDGYRWKWMFSVDETTWDKFATANFMPVIPNANVSSNAVSGSLDVIAVTNSGANYNSYHSGALQVVAPGGDLTLMVIESTAATNSDFYSTSAIQLMTGPAAGQIRKIVDYTVNGSVKTVKVDAPFDALPQASDLYEISPMVNIFGDGTGAAARAVINAVSNSVARIEIVNRGQGYSWANCVITGNTGFIGNTQPNPASVRPIIPPSGGHGYDALRELGASAVTISTVFDASMSSNTILNQNSIRTFGLIQDVLFANVAINISSVVGNFNIGETVLQANTNTTGKITSANSSVLKLTNVRGFFQSGFTVTGQSSNSTATVGVVTGPTTYFKNSVDLIVDKTDPLNFIENELVTQGSNALGYVHSSTQISGTTYRVRLTNVRGTFNLTDNANDLEQLIVGELSTVDAVVTDVVLSDVVRGSGNVLFIDNVQPIPKSNNQSETVRLTFEF